MTNPKTFSLQLALLECNRLFHVQIIVIAMERPMIILKLCSTVHRAVVRKGQILDKLSMVSLNKFISITNFS